MFLKLILFVLIGYTIYYTFMIINENQIMQKINKYIEKKNKIYYEEYVKNYEKTKKIKLSRKINIFYNINLLLDKANLKRGIFINPITITLMGVVTAVICYMFIFNILKIVLLSLIIAIPTSLIPIVIIGYIGNYKDEKLEKIFLNFLLQFKNHIKISKDIVDAFKTVKTVEPLNQYIKNFVLEIESGIKFEKAIEHFKEKISITKFKEFFSNLQYCYLYGGDIITLIDKSYDKIEELQKEKMKRLEETKSARIVLVILIALNILVYISYINKNQENYLIMKNTIMGNLILYWNFISMWILIYMAEKVKKLDY